MGGTDVSSMPDAAAVVAVDAAVDAVVAVDAAVDAVDAAVAAVDAAVEAVVVSLLYEIKQHCNSRSRSEDNS
jgi:hypothetical protein